MPKQRITKEMVFNEGYRLAIEEGMDQVQVKIIAKNLNCSVQPVYSYFKNMEDLKNEILKAAFKEFMRQVSASIGQGDYLPALFHSFIITAQKEPNLFSYFKQGVCQNLKSFHELFNDKAVIKIADSLQIPEFQARTLLNNLMIYVIGLTSVMLAENIDSQEAIAQLAVAYEAFYAQAVREK